MHPEKIVALQEVIQMLTTGSLPCCSWNISRLCPPTFPRNSRKLHLFGSLDDLLGRQKSREKIPRFTANSH